MSDVLALVLSVILSATSPATSQSSRSQIANTRVCQNFSRHTTAMSDVSVCVTELCLTHYTVMRDAPGLVLSVMLSGTVPATSKSSRSAAA